MDEMKKQLDKLEEETTSAKEQLEKCVTWDDLNDTFRQEIVHTDADKTFEEERQKYPNYFSGLESLSALKNQLDEALKNLNETNRGLDYVKEKTGMADKTF